MMTCTKLRRNPTFAVLASVAFLTLSAACSSLAPTPDEVRVKLQEISSTLDPTNPDTLRDKIVSSRFGALVSFDQMCDELMSARVVYVGETHVHPDHHAIQFEVLKALHKKNPDLIIGMEMFQRPFQNYLDEYIMKRKITEEEFLKQTEYFKRWSYDYEFYKPIIDFARENALRVVAINVSQEIARKIPRVRIEGLPYVERESLPEIDTTDAGHRAFVAEVFKSHGQAFSEEMFEGFYQAQCVWEDTMADSIARCFERETTPETQMVVFVGRGHIQQRFGIPKRAYKRTGMEYRTVLPVEAANGEDLKLSELLTPEVGDYVWFTRPYDESMQSPKLGVQIDNALPIEKVVEDSPAKKAKLRPGDILLKVDEHEIRGYDDLRYALLGKKFGDTVKLTVRRGRKTIELNLVLEPFKPPEPKMPPVQRDDEKK